LDQRIAFIDTHKRTENCGLVVWISASGAALQMPTLFFLYLLLCFFSRFMSLSDAYATRMRP
jgi:hypothetical protein